MMQDVKTDVFEINKNIRYHNFGLSCYSGYMLLAFPENPEHVSLRQITTNQRGMKKIKLPVLNLIDEIDKINIQSRAILKLDIEGSEADMLSKPSFIDKFSSFEIISIELILKFANEKMVFNIERVKTLFILINILRF